MRLVHHGFAAQDARFAEHADAPSLAPIELEQTIELAVGGRFEILYDASAPEAVAAARDARS